MQCFEDINHLLFLLEKNYVNLHEAEVSPLLPSWLNQLFCIYL